MLASVIARRRHLVMDYTFDKTKVLLKRRDTKKVQNWVTYKQDNNKIEAKHDKT